MQPSPTPRNPRALKLVVGILIAAGIFMSARAARLVPQGTFFNGDGGLKWIMTRQFARGQWTVAVLPPKDPWLAEQWKRGHFPITPPFVYDINGRWIQCFPVFFPILVAPLWRIFGWSGLFIIPLVSAWLTWLIFYVVVMRMTSAQWARALWLAILIFCTPLTFYAATFWEHTIAVAMSFMGWSLMFDAPRRGKRRAMLQGLVGGGLMALAGYFRPEHFVLMAAIALAWIPRRNSDRANWLSFITGCAIASLLFVAINISLYGRPFGAHSYSTLDPLPFSQHLRQESLPAFPQMLHDLIYFVPITLAVLIAAGFLILRARSLDPRATRLLIALVLFVLGVPIIVSHAGGVRLGPRYYLGAIPFICVLGALLTEQLLCSVVARAASVRAVFAGLLVAAVAWGAFVNMSSLAGIPTLYEPSREVLAFLRQRPEQIIVIHDDALFLEIPSLSDEKSFLLYQSAEDLDALTSAFAKRGIGSWIVSVHHQPGQSEPETVDGGSADLRFHGERIVPMYVYDFYRVTLK